jgi:hypothetical protein
MSEIKLNVNPVGQDLVDQLRSLVPVRTGRLKNSIKYQVREVADGYVISLIMEDYFKWLKDRKLPPKLPTARELSLAAPPLPKMNTLGIVKQADLSPRSRGIMDRIDIAEAVTTLDSRIIEEQIKDILKYD